MFLVVSLERQLELATRLPNRLSLQVMESKGRVGGTTKSTVSPLNIVSNADYVIENYLKVLDKCRRAFHRNRQEKSLAL